jgi:hypothetical protein
MEGCSIQGSQDLKFENPNPGLHEYKVKTGRPYPITPDEWLEYAEWYKTTAEYKYKNGTKDIKDRDIETYGTLCEHEHVSSMEEEGLGFRVLYDV